LASYPETRSRIVPVRPDLSVSVARYTPDETFVMTTLYEPMPGWKTRRVGR
jgi:hypothetical protein